MNRIWTVLVILLLVTDKNLTAQDYKKYGIENENKDLPVGLNIGDSGPHFELFDSNGKMFRLANILEEGPVVILFYRGEWCPVCNRYLSSIQDSLELIEKTGAKLLAIGPETTENAAKMKDKVRSDFPILIDSNEEVMKAYDVLFNVTSNYQNKIRVAYFKSIANNNGQDDARLPIPATYIIDQNGKIIYKHFEYNYRDRASVKDLLEVLR